MANTTVMGISMPTDLMKLVDQQAKALGMNRSQYVVAALRDYLDNQAATARLFGNPKAREVFLKAMAQPGVLKSLASAMAEELDPEQLHLFHEGMTAGARVMGKLSKKKRGK